MSEDRRAAKINVYTYGAEECQGLCLRLRLMMSVVSLLRPVINLHRGKVGVEEEEEGRKEGAGEEVRQKEMRMRGRRHGR